jgi:hypothetical protein
VKKTLLRVEKNWVLLSLCQALVTKLALGRDAPAHNRFEIGFNHSFYLSFIDATIHSIVQG